MSKPRSFIDEIIDSLKDASIKIEKDWKLFKEGKMDKETFETEYHQVLSGWLSELKHEEHFPNNECEYKETNPDCKYFNKMNI